MTRRTLSLDIKFPLLMTGLALITSAVFVWLGHRELTRVLQESAGERLRANGMVVADLLARSVAPASAQMRRITSAPAVRAALGAMTGTAPRPGMPALEITAGDSTRIALRVVTPSGGMTVIVGAEPGGEGEGWAREAARTGQLSPVAATLGPVRSANGRPALEIAMPVHEREDGESLIGWAVETRAVQGRGAETIRRLAESSTLLLGQLGKGVWTDLENVVPGPPPGVRPDTVEIFDASTRGPGVGIGVTIQGTPWVLWLQRDRAAVLAPLDAFLIRVAPVALLLAILAFFIVWRVSHHVTHRIVALTKRVDRMGADPALAAAGTPSPVTIPGQDEIERLETSFDAMFDRTRKQLQLEGQLQQAQKLEAVGRLAGGIAHDFNNVLTVITNYGEMLRADAEDGTQAADDLDQVLRAAERASHLTRQLLAFSKRQILQPRRLSINGTVRDAHAMLRRLIPTNIALDLDLSDDLPEIVADPIQVEQVLVNLAVNAADAMPNGGQLLFRSTPGELDPEDARHGAPVVKYACIVVRDTGTGMDRETAARIFEPFFTTKAQGKGTGLGLATVHGIVTQLGGRIWVYSELGKGTTFKIYLPVATADTPSAEPSARRRSTPPQGAGDILVVEDDEAARLVTERILKEAGFTVRTAADGATALRLLQEGPLPRVVVSDLMMPAMDGATLSQRIHERWPTLPVVIMSGYADVELGTGAIIAAVVLEKPFTSRAIVDAISRAAAATSAP